MTLMTHIRPVSVFILLLFSSYVTSAQATLQVRGARVNMINNVYVSTNNVAVSGNGLVNVAGATIKVAGSMTSAEAINVSNGTVEMNGTTPQQLLAGSLSGKFIKALTINNTAGVTVNDTVKLTDVLTVANGNLISGGFLTLKSYDISTARVAPVTSLAADPITGNIIVERLIAAKRAFRFLTAPVNTAGSIRDNWMEGVNNSNTTSGNINPVPGFGTHITGRGGYLNNFDETITNNPSLLVYNNQSQAWAAVPNANSTFKAGNGFSVFVRGNRTANLNSDASPASPATLRAKGTLVTGTVILKAAGAGGTANITELATAAGAYTFIANPYASPVNWLLLDLAGITGTMYIFDATINGSGGRGGYVAFNRTIGPAGVSSNDTSKIDNNIQSGQAFFVQTSGPNPSVTFKEIYKTSQHRAVFREPNGMAKLSLHLLIANKQSGNSSADGLSAYFSDDFNSSLGNEDSYKFNNQDENIAIVRNGKTLSIEGRKPVISTDTIPLKMWHLTLKEYALKVTLTNFSENTQGYLEDDFLHTTTLLGNEASTTIPFSITGDSLSATPDRFKIVFKPSGTVLAQVSGIKAYPKNEGVQVEWTAVNENNTDSFVVEKSVNAWHFTAAGLVKVKDNTGINTNLLYEWFDENAVNGYNYYRIKYIEKTGEVRYSRIVKVYINANPGTITVVTSAVRSNLLNVVFKNVVKGNYDVSLTNNLGQKVYTGNIVHNGGFANYSVKVKNYLAAGLYHLYVLGDNKVENIQVLIQ